MLSTVTYMFSPQGVIQVGRRDATTGAVTKYSDLGDAPTLSISLKTEVEEVNESTSGQRLPLHRQETGKSAEVSLTLRSFDRRTLSLLVRGSAEDVAADSVTGEVMPSGLVAGDIVKLAYPFVTNVVVKDSAGTPVTVNAADYTVDAGGGMIRIVDPTGYTQPFKVDYDYAANETVALFTEGQVGYSLVFSGVNTARANEPIQAELYNFVPDPADNIDLITEKSGTFTLKGSLLIDSTKDADDPLLGQFGRIIRKAA
jgi:hypothetical protein